MTVRSSTRYHPTTKMHPPEEDSRIISGDGPVNLRTALKHQRAQDAARNPQQLAPLQERIDRMHMRNRFGAPLVEQVSLSRAGPQKPASSAQIAAGVCSASGCVLTLLGAIQSHVPLLAAGIAIAACGAVGWKILHGRATSVSADAHTQSPLMFDEAALALFDTSLEKAAAELDDENASRLVSIKDAFKRIGNQAVIHDEHFTLEDRMYLRECLRRYVPDSVDAYLHVPAAQRNQTLLADQPCAQAALLQQLDLLLDEILLREKKISRNAAERLARQQRFLASKKSH